ncbi:hypothetical protein V3481_007152 [Fusarium oxysporum f. sp. vasinfectum]
MSTPSIVGTILVHPEPQSDTYRQHLQQPIYYQLQNQKQSTPPHALTSLYSRGDPCSEHCGRLNYSMADLRVDNGVPWITFQYSREKGEKEYTIPCDIESVIKDELSPQFKKKNYIYPRAYCHEGQYKGNRWLYETDCNHMVWALANLNPVLQGRRGRIQQAVNIWRNMNPKLRSRKARRIAKETDVQPPLTPSP